MKKAFCDLCGKPAMDTAFTHLTFKRKILNRKGYHLTVEFTDAKENYPTTRDERADCCEKCMASGLRSLADQLEGQQDEGGEK